MKTFLAAGALALALTGPALAQADMKMGDMKMDDMAGMKHDAPAATKTADGQGVIKGIDAAGGTVTLQHQPDPGAQMARHDHEVQGRPRPSEALQGRPSRDLQA